MGHSPFTVAQLKGFINNGKRYADRGFWGTKSVLFGVNSN
jgi:hypothetical protein